jgi:hypothetical protein
MDKILVEIYLPSVNKNYDVYIPVKSKLYEISTLLARAFNELSGDYFSAAEDTVICDRVTGMILNINMSAEGLGLRNGSKLMFI